MGPADAAGLFGLNTSCRVFLCFANPHTSPSRDLRTRGLGDSGRRSAPSIHFEERASAFRSHARVLQAERSQVQPLGPPQKENSRPRGPLAFQNQDRLGPRFKLSQERPAKPFFRVGIKGNELAHFVAFPNSQSAYGFSWQVRLDTCGMHPFFPKDGPSMDECIGWSNCPRAYVSK